MTFAFSGSIKRFVAWVGVLGAVGCKTGSDASTNVKDVAPDVSSDSGVGEFVELNLDECQASSSVRLDHVREVGRMYVPTSLPPEVSACGFAEQLEGILTVWPPVQTALIAAKVGIFVRIEGDVLVDRARPRLEVPLAISGQKFRLLEVLLGISPAPKVNTPFVFPANKNLIWRMFGGRHDLFGAKAACKSLGPGWELPTVQQVETVASSMTERVMSELGPGSTVSNQFYLQGLEGACTEVPIVSLRRCRGNEKIAVCVFDVVPPPM